MAGSHRPFGQRQEVWVALRKLIRDYPGDVGIFKELIQNADDGGARRIRLIIDPRENRHFSGPLTGMEQLGGPAILAENDQPFSAEDFENIQRLGDSDKIGAAGKTGRFGLGFNSIYNVTDFPLLLTGEHFCLFDPRAAIVEDGQSGAEWLLDDGKWRENARFLDLFAPAGYVAGTTDYRGTIFRLPLRNLAHIKLAKERKISDVVFGPERFDELVAGLGEIADSLLLFLKHLEFIGCYRVDPISSKCVPLLEIETLNAEEVQRGRARANDVLGAASVDEALTRIAAADGGEICHAFVHEMRINAPGKRPRTIRWRVAAGLFAGKEGRLVAKARELLRHHEKAIPSSGVAVCLARGDEVFPQIKGQVCCFLPLGSKAGTFPVQLHGAFDIDSSRSDLTPHTPGEDERKRLRGQWNELLIEDGLARAYCHALGWVKERDLAGMTPEAGANALYSVFPDPAVSVGGPLAKLPAAVYAGVAARSLLRCVDGSWEVPAKLVRLPMGSETALTAALAAEGFRFPQPELPERVVLGLGSAAPPVLRSCDLQAHFHTQEEMALPLAEVPYPGLRKRKRLEAVVRFLASDVAFTDWSDLPLALCTDGKLHTFGVSDPAVKFLATARQRRIFAPFPEWFLDDDFAQSTGLFARGGRGYEWMTPRRLVPLLDHVTDLALEAEDDDNEPTWNPAGAGAPNRVWLLDVLAELNAAAENEQPSDPVIDAAFLVPGNDGKLHCPGDVETPLLVSSPQRKLCPMLETLGVLHYTLSGGDPLSSELERFASIYGRVWRLTPGDLIDTLCKSDEPPGEIPPPAATNALLVFLSSTEGLKKLQEDGVRRARLRGLPFYEDQTGRFAALDSSCYLTGSFQPPEAALPIRLLRESGWRELLVALGVEELNRLTLFETYVLPAYDAQSPPEQRTLLKWIRDERTHILTECEDLEERESVRRLVSETPLIRSTAGSLKPIVEIYDPAHRELIQSVLGEEAALPDMTFYGDQEDLWLAFFREFHLATTPRAQDLMDFMLGLSEKAAADETTAAVTKQVDLFLAHVTQHWETLHIQTVQGEDGLEVTFAEFLRDLSWCPAVRDTERFGASEPPEDRLYGPAELFLAEQGNLVASQAPLLKQGRRRPSPEMCAALGFRETPEPPIVAEHLRAMSEPYATRSLDEAEHKKVQGPARNILEYFGRFDLEGGDRLAVEAVFTTLSRTACVYHPVRRQFYRPCDLFQKAPPCLEPWKIDYVPGGSTKGLLAEALDRLGRRESPEAADYLDALRSLHAKGSDGGSLSRGEARRFLDIQAALARVVTASSLLEDCPVLDRQNVVAEADAVLHLDDAWLETNMPPVPGLRLLHKETPEPLIELLGIARVSYLLQKSPACILEESRAPAFRSHCKRLETVIAHPEFQRGLQRIAHWQHGFEGGSLRLPDVVTLHPVTRLVCENAVVFHEERFILNRVEDDYCVECLEAEGRRILLAESATDTLPDVLAQALNELLLRALHLDSGLLAAMLRSAPEEISRQLDRRRVPQLAQVHHQAGTHSTSGGEIEFEELPSDSENRDETPDDTLEDGKDVDIGTDDEIYEANDSAPTEGIDKDAVGEGDWEEEIGDEVDKTPSTDGQPHGTGAGVRARSVDWGGAASRTAGRRGRMLPGEPHAETRAANTSHSSSPRRQDDLWISRARTREQTEEEQRNGDIADDAAPNNDRIGTAAVGWVLQYERNQGRRPQNMAHANPGYDVESSCGRVLERIIEVKGINGEWGRNGVPLSSIQLEKARELGEQFWLYVVENVLDVQSVRIHTIQNPYEKITQFRFDSGWQACGQDVDFQPLEPKAELRIYIQDHGMGEIFRAQWSGTTCHLQVSFGDNTPARSFTYNPLYMQLLPSDGR